MIAAAAYRSGIALCVASALVPAQAASDTTATLRSEAQAAWESSHDSIGSLGGVVEIRDARTRHNGSYLRCAWSMKKPDRWWMDFAHVTAGRDWRDDRRRHISFVKDAELTVEWPAHGTFERVTLRRDEAPERFAVLPVWRASGWWPSWVKWRCPKIGDTSLDVLAALRDPRYSLAQDDPAGLVVLERAKVDRIVLDRARGFALVEREIRDEKTQTILSRTRVTKLTRVTDEFWFPSHAKVDVFGRTGGEQPGSRPINEMEVRIMELHVNDLADASFEYKPGPGSYFVDREGNRSGLVEAGGAEILTRAGELALQRATRHPIDWTRLSIVLSFVAASAAWFLFRRRSRRSARKSSPHPRTHLAMK